MFVYKVYRTRQNRSAVGGRVDACTLRVYRKRVELIYKYGDDSHRRFARPRSVARLDERDLLAGRSFLLFVSPPPPPPPRDRLINHRRGSCDGGRKPRPPAGHRQPMVGGYIVSAALLDVLAAAACLAWGGRVGRVGTHTVTRAHARAGGGTRTENRLGPDNRYKYDL